MAEPFTWEKLDVAGDGPTLVVRAKVPGGYVLAVGTGADEYRLITFLPTKKWKVRTWREEQAERKEARAQKKRD